MQIFCEIQVSRCRMKIDNEHVIRWKIKKNFKEIQIESSTRQNINYGNIRGLTDNLIVISTWVQFRNVNRKKIGAVKTMLQQFFLIPDSQTLFLMANVTSCKDYRILNFTWQAGNPMTNSNLFSDISALQLVWLERWCGVQTFLVVLPTAGIYFCGLFINVGKAS